MTRGKNPNAPSTASILQGVFLALVAVGGALFYGVFDGCGPDPTGPLPQVRYDTYFVVPDGDRTLIAVIVGDEPARVATFDARTGERVAWAPVCGDLPDDPTTVHQPDGHLVWVSCGQADLALLDLRTGAAVHTTASLAARHPELTKGIRLDHPTVSHDVDSPTRGLSVRLHDGRTAWIDLAGDLHFAPVPTDPWRPGYFCWPEDTCSTVRRECLTFVPSPTGPGSVLASARLHGEPSVPTTLVGEWPAGLLLPGFVKQPDTRCVFEHDDSYLILHDSAAFDPKETLLSRVDRDGTVRWTRRNADLGAAEGYEARRARRVGDEVLVTLTHERTRDHLTVAVLDLHTGEVRASRTLIGTGGSGR